MAWFKRSSRFTILAVVLLLDLAVKIPASVQAQLRPNSLSSKLPNQWKSFQPPTPSGDFRPLHLPGEGATLISQGSGTEFRAPRSPENPSPENTQGGGSRSPCIESGSLVALVPASGGVTVAEHPTISWYMPQISLEAEAPAVEFVLRDANKQQIYSAQYPLTKSREGVVGTPGIMSLTVANPYSMKIGQDYYWELSVRCNYKGADRSEDPFVEGRLKRVEPDPTLALRIQQATPKERVALYANAQLWYDAFATLVELKRDRPNDTELAATWDKLLTSMGL